MSNLTAEELNTILIENRQMRKALEFIQEWQLPASEWKGVPCSYEASYGSNGARDYMRDVARKALVSEGA